MKILPVGAELFHADRQTWRSKAAFRNSVNALKNGLLRTPLSKPRHSVHLLISLYISVLHHSKARSTL
jgi:hypothetical protein